jgi:thiamine biosynthesis lipoprotein
MSARVPVEFDWAAMGTEARLVVCGPAPERLARQAVERIEQLEQRWSRFRPTSELNALNARTGLTTTVSDDTRLLVERAIEGWWLSGGAFDPTLLGDVVRAGYDRSFVELAEDAPERHSPYLAGCDGIGIERNDITLPDRVGIDSGGLGKGLAADLVVAELLEAGADGACVSIGGDLAVAGHGPTPDGGWTVDIADPWSAPSSLALIGLRAGGIATSSTLKRTWLSGGTRRHHVIDPRSHEPAQSGLVHVTVISGAAWRSEIFAKAVLVNGGPTPFDLLGGTEADAMAVGERGAVSATEGFLRYLGGASLPSRLTVPLSAARP